MKLYFYFFFLERTFYAPCMLCNLPCALKVLKIILFSRKPIQILTWFGWWQSGGFIKRKPSSRENVNFFNQTELKLFEIFYEIAWLKFKSRPLKKKILENCNWNSPGSQSSLYSAYFLVNLLDSLANDVSMNSIKSWKNFFPPIPPEKKQTTEMLIEKNEMFCWVFFFFVILFLRQWNNTKKFQFNLLADVWRCQTGNLILLRLRSIWWGVFCFSTAVISFHSPLSH